MYLKYLTIKDSDDFVIRHVDFKLGANIIKGDVTDNNLTSNTNSIGKTTLIRSLDFCLGGKWESLVNDRELKSNRNNTVFDFFRKTSPSFELLIVRNLTDRITWSLKINRILSVEYGRNKKEKVSIKNFIDDNEVSDNVFKSILKESLFELTSEKPRLRQLIPKFIRASDHQVSNIVRYLNPMTSNADYELLHLFLFDFSGMDLIHQRIAVEAKLKETTEQVKSLKSLVSAGTQEVTDLNISKLDELQEQYENYEISNHYKRENDELNLIKESISNIKSDITQLYLDKEIWKDRLYEINSKNDSINSESIAYMYKEAELYNAQLQKKYDETVAFHQTMLKNEIEFINKTLLKSNERLSVLESEYVLQSKKYNILLKKLGDSGSLAEYTLLGNQINQLTKEIAESQAILNSYHLAVEKQNKLKTEFEKLTEELNEVLTDFRRKLTVFNRYFSKFSKELSEANSGYLLAVEEDRNHHFNLLPRPVDGDSNVGDGHKQGVIVAFDLAYMAYASDPSIDLVRPYFFTQDKVEIMDVNTLAKLITLANDTKCQFIFPIIKDKQDNLSNFDENDVILTLDDSDKFFDIENYQRRKQSLYKSSKEISSTRFIILDKGAYDTTLYLRNVS